MCRRRCRRGCGCWARAGQTRTTRTTRVLRLLAKAHLDVGRARNRASCRLHALARELVAGGIRKEVVVSQAESLLAEVEPVGVAQGQRLELAYELVDEIRALDAKLRRSKARITTAVV